LGEAFIILKPVPKLAKCTCVLIDNGSIYKGKKVEKVIIATAKTVKTFLIAETAITYGFFLLPSSFFLLPSAIKLKEQN
jgi:hypothetical protein